jgi:hypothetical protein
MATFPESSPTPLYPLIIEPEFNTLISGFDGGGEQRRKKLLFPKYNVTVEYNPLSIADAKTVWEFYMARKGASEAFYIYDFSLLPATSFNHVGEYCGIGDGSATIFDIPGKSTSSQTIYMDGVDETSNVTILTGGGESNSDRAQFDVAAPASGNIITADFTGFLRMRVRFAEDKMTREAFNYKLFQYGLKLKGLAPA